MRKPSEDLSSLMVQKREVLAGLGRADAHFSAFWAQLLTSEQLPGKTTPRSIAGACSAPHTGHPLEHKAPGRHSECMAMHEGSRARVISDLEAARPLHTELTAPNSLLRPARSCLPSARAAGAQHTTQQRLLCLKEVFKKCLKEAHTPKNTGLRC